MDIYDGETRERRFEKIRFQYRIIGLKAHYAAAQEGTQVDFVLRIPQVKGIDTLDYVVIENESYLIQRVKPIYNTYPKTIDLTLEKSKRV